MDFYQFGEITEASHEMQVTFFCFPPLSLYVGVFLWQRSGRGSTHLCTWSLSHLQLINSFPVCPHRQTQRCSLFCDFSALGGILHLIYTSCRLRPRWLIFLSDMFQPHRSLSCFNESKNRKKKILNCSALLRLRPRLLLLVTWSVSFHFQASVF